MADTTGDVNPNDFHATGEETEAPAAVATAEAGEEIATKDFHATSEPLLKPTDFHATSEPAN
ncbi:hypothetical protein [Streptomyces sp. NPDC018693]|uniref:hypothetical protein n=1 Tax=unclassified Streptomyces TaxID=2593676 RepID=UPI0037B5C960